MDLATAVRLLLKRGIFLFSMMCLVFCAPSIASPHILMQMVGAVNLQEEGGYQNIEQARMRRQADVCS